MNIVKNGVTAMVNAHIRAALMKPCLTVPIENGKLILGQWQNIVLIDFDNREREREIIVKIIKQ